ncbi:unnamed protein product [Acanthoscelides obtectus]|uniref:Enhancer of mRNA-decapping protein 4 n=2 Tax=Acanthoscelides obtectus TaxID=200917 RepID=A0A9P0LCW0_ACAOB|nr:unnamed protein product [Acanthoscelides obtectus]CAK1636168.1 Enhancer of mRNA-decapping protein 4 [Acanthoscelides obtectus]
MASSEIVPKSGSVQTIKYSGAETEFCAKVEAETVLVHCKEGKHSHGSSKVKLTDKIDYNWEFRYYHGNLVAAHIGGKVIAYCMKGKDGGMVRITNQETGVRTLIKNLKEDIKDLAFAFSREEIILGCVDSEGNILVYQIEDGPHSITFSLLLHVFHQSPNRGKANFRLIWCPFLPSYEEDADSSDDPEKMFVVLNGNTAEVFNVTMLNAKYGKGNTLDPNDTYEGYIRIPHTAEVIDASFSSDGTALAIASTDGYVKFFQLYMLDDEKQKCLHEWRPHGGEALSSIIFIDNVLEYSSECWKFAITGANNNSEIKLWSCESWVCLQTIHFKSDPSNLITALYLNLSIDYTGQYLVVSDINNCVLYLLELKRNDKEQTVFVTMLSQFLLPAAFLSVHILEACTKNVPILYNNSNEDLYQDPDDYDEGAEIAVTSLKMLVIQPKKFQECNIVFHPETIMYSAANVSDEIQNKSAEKEKVPKLDDLQESVTLLIQQHSNSNLALMTPDDFTTPNSERPKSARNDSSNSKSKSDGNDNIDLIDFQRPQKENNFASGGSSPSREVQEILSCNNSTYSNQDYFDNLTKIQDAQEEPQKDYKDKNSLAYQDQTELVWPKIPVVKENEIKEDRIYKELRLQSAESTSQLQALNLRLGALETTIREQNLLIQKLDQDRIDKDEFVKELDCAMSKQQLQIVKVLENLMNAENGKHRELQEQLATAVTQFLGKSLGEKIQISVAHEMKHVILPAVHNMAESYRKQIDAQYSQKLANTDIMLRENVAKAFNSKALADTLSHSVVNIVAPSLEKCYRDIISSSLIPSWEKVCGKMFQQINETFTKGTKEYTASVESYMDRQRRVQEKGKDLIVQMQSVSENMKTNADKLTSTLTSEIHKQFNAVFKTMQDKMTHSIKEVVADQVKQGFKNHASVIEDSVINAVRSRAVTPSPNIESHVTILNQIQQHLERGNYDGAFQLALSAENLEYVIYVCERVDIHKIFGEDCVLQQNCLLALIQQLSMELHKNTELKLCFIRAAFLALDQDYPNTKHFIPKVLKELLKHLNFFIKTNPQGKHNIEAQLLKMAVESMMRK